MENVQRCRRSGNGFVKVNLFMAIETEIKFRLSEEQSEFVRESLIELDADFIGEDFEENTIYGGGILQEQNAILRIRKIDSKTILTFKKRLPSETGIKEQIEHETDVSNSSEVEKIIDYLGFEKRVVYEKRRKTWKCRDVEVVLDELPFGLFMEIEGEKKAIDEAVMLLELESFEVEYKTYPRLTSELGKSNGSCFESRF